MNTTSRIAAVAGSLVTGAAVAAAIILPLHHAPAGAATAGPGARTVTSQASAGAGAQHSSGASNNGPAGAGSGSAAGSGGSGSGSGNGSGSGSGSGNGSGSGSHLKITPAMITLAPPSPAPHLTITPGMTGIIDQAPPKPTIWVFYGINPNLGPWPIYGVAGDNFSLGGQALFEVVANGTGQVMWHQTVNASPFNKNPGATAYIGWTGVRDCSGVPNTTNGYYMTAEDLATGQWSNDIPVDSYC